MAFVCLITGADRFTSQLRNLKHFNSKNLKFQKRFCLLNRFGYFLEPLIIPNSMIPAEN